MKNSKKDWGESGDEKILGRGKHAEGRQKYLHVYYTQNNETTRDGTLRRIGIGLQEGQKQPNATGIRGRYRGASSST